MRRRTSIRFIALLLFLAAFGALPAQAQSTYTRTQYPIVLVHGLFGFDSVLGVYDYWYGIGDELRAGGATVYTASVSAANSSEVRGEQLIRDLDRLRAITGKRKFNLLGHSHGGQTIRYVASVRPDLVASVTQTGTPNLGSPVADGVSNTLPPGSPLRGLVAGFVNAFSGFIGALSGSLDPQDSLAALGSLNSGGARAFNSRHPQGMPTTSCGSGAAQVNGVYYYSMGGTSVLTNILDITDPALGAGGLFFGFEQNDGLVGRCSSHWGTVLRDNYSWNHLDEVNQFLGLRGLFASDPRSVYRAQANRLKNLGL
ncbi:MAG: triacylglycerol lipase [Xanthomonadaceae bacterium]|nr:triacylglycerol lipase [Xanthomonadaceae bacterium]